MKWYKWQKVEEIVSFRGSSVHTIDKSNRISVPSKARDVLMRVYADETFILTIGRRCIVAYPIREWEKIEAELLEKPAQNAEEANERRRFEDYIEEVSVDKQGRISIPVRLRQYAGLEGDCQFLGRGNRIEIWSKSVWEAELGSEPVNFEKLGVSHLMY
jgi:MraZ protein